MPHRHCDSYGILEPMNTEKATDRGLMTLMAVSLFAGAGVIHFQTPMLSAIGADFGADTAAVGWVATLTFGGFLAGLVFVVPLGDRLDKRTLVLAQIAVLVPVLLAMAAAPTLSILAAASFVAGACSSIGASFVAIVAELARPSERGRELGSALTAVFLGILFARMAGGFVAAHLGWRWMFVIAALMMLVLFPALAKRLPAMRGGSPIDYLALIGSMAQLLRRHEKLRRVSGTQFLLGISYGAFWATIAPMLALFHHLGPSEAGLMGIPGAAGIIVASAAGRWSDRRGVGPVVTGGAILVLVSFVVLGFAGLWIGAVIAGAVVLDVGIRITMVANQVHVNTLASDARSRFNTVYAASVWGGNAAGALLASTALAHAGWLPVCAIAVSCSGLALLAHLRKRAGTR